MGFSEANVKEASEEKVIGWIRSWLEKKSKWLLLLDNADDETIKEIFPLLPRKGGHVILTTREFIPPTEAMTIHVGKMEKEEALSLLFSPTSLDLINRESTQFHNAQKIITELDCTPLAINLARAYINNVLMSFKDFLSEFKRERSILFRYSDEDNLGDYKHTVETVWQLSFERIRAISPTAVKILEACAFFQPDAIPTSFFEHRYSSLNLMSVSPANEPDHEQQLGRQQGIRGGQSIADGGGEVQRGHRDGRDAIRVIGDAKSVRVAIGVLIKF